VPGVAAVEMFAEDIRFGETLAAARGLGGDV